MQLLYALDRDKELTSQDLLPLYRQVVNQSFDLYLFALKIFMAVASHATKEAKSRHSKHLPSKEDRSFRPYLADNSCIKSLSNNGAFAIACQKHQEWPAIDDDIVRLLYYQSAKKQEYINYATSMDPSEEDHKKQLLALFKDCCNNEAFTDLLEYNYRNWIDDKSLIIGAIKKTIKSLPAKEDFLKVYKPNPETIEEFGLQLLQYVQQENTALEEYILPTLKNWDAERVAVLDMILLKLALSELIMFTSIPTKVTLNEYVEISKLYSTEKSKDFINGILDRLMKDLTATGKINKSGRGLVG
ncbi:MAG: transcription antitermination protein NusB [Saprospiraceae bacterium]|nr:transcription antitermination protein NusB [Saprospiraceae bacterium]